MEKKMSVSRKKLFWFLLIVVILAAVVYGIFRANHKRQVALPAPVTPELSVSKAKGQDVSITYNYIGQVEAINQTAIVPYISGYVINIAATGGQSVKKGDILAVLKQDEYIARLGAAQAALFAQKADFFNAKVKYDRMKNAGDEAFSKQELDNAKAEYLTAAGNLEKAKADQYIAENNYSYTYITAPFDGILGNIGVSLGDYISPQSVNVMSLVQFNPIRVVFSVSDKEFLSRFENKNNFPLTVKVCLANGEVLPQQGKIKYTANAIDKSTNALAVYAEFPNPDNLLLPNAYVQVLLEQSYQNAVLIPKPQLVMKTDGDYVYTIKNGVLNLHKLHSYGETDDNVVALNDFAEDEFIVQGSVETFVPGDKAPYKVINTEQ